MEEATESGRPPMINRDWFRARYGQSFPDLLDDEQNELLDGCIETVYTMFYGVGDIWKNQKRNLYYHKTRDCYGLLVAWYITDLYPDYAVGVISSGGIPIASKSIGGVKIAYTKDQRKAGAANNADLLSSLKSNAFGAKAYFMIKSSGYVNFFLASGGKQ